MHVGPDVLAGAGMGGIAALFRELDQQRHLHAVAAGAVADAVDQARADDDGAAALVAIRQNELVERDPRDARGRRRDRRVLVEDASERSPRERVPTMLDPEVWMKGLPLPASASSSAATAPLWSALAALTTTSAACAARARISRVIQRAHHGLDAERANRVGLFRGANEAGDLMAGGSEMRCDRSADIARCAGAEDFHGAAYCCHASQWVGDARHPIREQASAEWIARRFVLAMTTERRPSPQMLPEKLRRPAPGQLGATGGRARTARCSLTKACSAS